VAVGVLGGVGGGDKEKRHKGLTIQNVTTICFVVAPPLHRRATEHLVTDLSLLVKPLHRPITSFEARVRLYHRGLTCGALAAYHVDRLGSRPETADDARVVEAIIDRVCGVSL
jgi:hypothetical protein